MKANSVASSSPGLSFFSIPLNKETALQAAKIATLAASVGLIASGAVWGVYTVANPAVNVKVIVATGLVGAIAAVLNRSSLLPKPPTSQGSPKPIEMNPF